MKKKRDEAELLGYKLLYNRTGNLVTERLTTDITQLKKYFSTSCCYIDILIFK